MIARDDIGAILTAALRAINPESLVAGRCAIVQGALLLAGQPLNTPLRVDGRGRIVIVGGGKAAAGMAAGLVDVLLRGGVGESRIQGIVSVPQGSGRLVPGVDVRETRPATQNVPTLAAEAATREMLALVGSLEADDVVIAVISGGGSALLAAPRAGVPLEEKIALARFLASAGAPITDINAVRQAASDVKGGGLARACSAGRMLVLVLSDVIGDPLEAIASGPCMPVAADAALALALLERYGAVAAGIAPRLVALLGETGSRSPIRSEQPERLPPGSWVPPRGCRVEHVLVGSNVTAVDAAAVAARRLGYDVTVRHAHPDTSETADEVGRRLAHEGLALRAAAAGDGRPRALVEGGEAVVCLPADHGQGGRNQQTIVAALAAILGAGCEWPRGLALTSIGTDGEDGPTDAAGGIADALVAQRITAGGFDATHAAARCDARSLLEAVDGLVMTGPTGTNVADLRVILACPLAAE